jgi:uncharacterized membrane-anchored protein YjiN (DUF445 family)
VENGIQLNEKEFMRKVNITMYELAEEIKLSTNQKVQRNYYQKLNNVIKKLKKDGRVRERQNLTSK